MKEYFSHDFDARSDKKIIRLLMNEGLLGYGIYWAIVEMIYQNFCKIDYDCNCIAFALQTDSKIIERVINDYGLFENDGKYIWSESINRRVNDTLIKSKKMSENAKKRWGNKHIINDVNAIALQNECKSNASKEKKSKEKVNKSKVKKSKEFIAPTLSEIENFVKEKSYDFDCVKFYNFFTDTGWTDANGKKVKNWKQKLITWNSFGNCKLSQQNRQQQQPQFKGAGYINGTREVSEEEINNILEHARNYTPRTNGVNTGAGEGILTEEEPF